MAIFSHAIVGNSVGGLNNFASVAMTLMAVGKWKHVFWRGGCMGLPVNAGRIFCQLV